MGSCISCHRKVDASSEQVNGFEWLQLNHSDQLSNLVESNRFSHNEGLLDQATLDTSDTSVAAKGFIHSNCSGCHQPGGFTGVSMDLRFSEIHQSTVGVSAEHHDGILIDPGSPQSSLLLESIRSTLEDEVQMPPLGRSTVDTESASILEEWIRSL